MQRNPRRPENSGNKDDLENVRTKGEALFFRAYCYFNLVRAWGEVPLVTFKVKEASDANRAQKSCERDIRTDRQGPDRSREMPAADMDFRVHRTHHLGSRPLTARPYLHDAQRLGQYVRRFHRSHQVRPLQPEHARR